MLRFVARLPFYFSKITPQRIQNEKLGRWAELVVKYALLMGGYRCIEHRYTNPFGELDLVFKKKSQLIFCEVKYRETYDLGAISITHHQKNRIKKGAQYFFAHHPHLTGLDCRFDAMIVTPKRFHWIKDAWQMEST